MVLPEECNGRRQVLRLHLREIAAGAERGIPSEAKRTQIERRIRSVEDTLDGSSQSKSLHPRWLEEADAAPSEAATV